MAHHPDSPQPSDPPRLFDRLLSLLLPDDEVGRSVLGDLREEYAARRTLEGEGASGRSRPGWRSGSRWWYRRQALGIGVRALARRLVGGGPPRLAAPPRDPAWRQWARETTHVVRALAKAPRFTLVTTFTLALGIGATTAIFSVINAVLLRPLEYPAAEELVGVWSHAPGLGYDQFPLSPDVYYFYRAESRSLADLGIFQALEVNLLGESSPERVPAAVVSRSVFTTLGEAPALGRFFAEEEDLPGGPPVVVLSHGLWMRRFGGDEGVLGRTLQVNGVAREIIGVMPPRFAFEGAELWYPTGLDPENPLTGSFTWNVIGRLAKGVGPEEAERELVPLVRRILEANADAENYVAFLENGRYQTLIHPLKEDVVGSLVRPLWVLFGTVGFVLLIACANVANLVLIRAEVRQRETAVRATLGASRGRLLRHQMMENGVLALGGASAGLLVAWLGTPLLLRFAPPQLPRFAEVGVDGPVLAFTLAVTALSALAFGLVPALRHSRASVLGPITRSGSGNTAARSRRIGRDLLVIGQTGLALILLVGSGLLFRSFQAAWTADPGFDYEEVLTFRISLPPPGYPTQRDVAVFHRELRARLATLPGVTDVGATSHLPMQAGPPGTAYVIEGQAREPGQLPPLIHYSAVTPGFLEALGIDLVAGRTLEPGQDEIRSDNVVINRALADEFWPGGSPVGHRLRTSGDSTGWFNVVGVVETILHESLREEPRPLIYHVVADSGGVTAGRALTYALKGRNVGSLSTAVREAVWAQDPELPLARMQPMREVVSDSLVQLSFTMLTLGVAALLALILGAVGVYGVLSYAVSRRTKEIGVRMALGAERGTVLRMVVANGARLSVLGLLVGLAGAAALTRILQGLLFGTEPLDLLTFSAMSGVLLLVGIAASYLPARRAAAVSPMASIRAD